jgi:hypothetical protein
MPSFVAIAAMDPQGVIGKEGKLPWHYPEDLKHFDRLTKDQVIIMGYITFLSLPSRILNSRRCFVFTKNHSISESNVTSIKSLKELYDTRPALVNFGEHLLCSSALLDRSKPSRFGATSATLLEPKICCPNSPDLTAHRIISRGFIKKVLSFRQPLIERDEMNCFSFF